jgi:hypothetical protein
MALDVISVAEPFQVMQCPKQLRRLWFENREYSPFIPINHLLGIVCLGLAGADFPFMEAEEVIHKASFNIHPLAYFKRPEFLIVIAMGFKEKIP